MAAIDKLYVSSYDDLSDLRKWAYAYYPKLLPFFYDTALQINYKEFAAYKRNSAKASIRIFKAQWEKFSSDGTINCAIAHFKSLGMAEHDAELQAKSAYEDYIQTPEEVEDKINLCVMNTPTRIDKKLKWICPLSCVRKYLVTQCGVKEHWYYKLFWKGKKYFT